MCTRRYKRVFAPWALALVLVLGTQGLNGQIVQTQLPGKNLPKYVDPLPTFVGARVNGTHPLTVSMEEFQSMVLPAATYTALAAPFNLGTFVWGYKIVDQTTSTTYGPNYPGFTVEAQRGSPTSMTFINNLVNPVLQSYLVVDQTIHWAAPTGMDMMNMQPYTGPVPAVVHLHGGEVPSAIDGGPDAWFTPNSSGPSEYTGSAYNAKVNGIPVGNTYVYPNTQEPATLWFHDHTLGATRINVFAGLAAFYFLRGGNDTGPGNSLGLPADPYEIELAIQDRMFDVNGQLLFPNLGINPTIHPFWIPEFFGDVIVVNGKSWPYLNVEPRRYRLRFLDGSNARFYELWLQNLASGSVGPAIYQIGTDGGLLDLPVKLDPALGQHLFIAPGERADVIIDFSRFAGQTLTLKNGAKAPFPKGTAADPNTTGQVMQFRVVTALNGTDVSYDPAAGGTLRATPLVKLVNFAAGTTAVASDITRKMTLNEIATNLGPREILVNNSKWDGALSPNAGGITELPQQGATEEWDIINLTMDAHPIHLHLVQFQLINRQDFNVTKYVKAYNAGFPGGVSPIDGLTYAPGAFIPGWGPPAAYASTLAAGYLGGNPDVTPYLQGKATPADPNEQGWKDTFKMYPGQVTRVLVRFAPTDAALGSTTPGTNAFAFDPTEGPGYVWHCHIVDHEDNEMMRPYQVKAGAQASMAIAARSVTETITGETKPMAFSLEQNFPNPFNPSTEIRFALPSDTHVRLTVYNALGQEIQTLVDAEAPAGQHLVRLDASNLSSGVYFYRIQAGTFSSTKKMIVMK